MWTTSNVFHVIFILYLLLSPPTLLLVFTLDRAISVVSLGSLVWPLTLTSTWPWPLHCWILFSTSAGWLYEQVTPEALFTLFGMFVSTFILIVLFYYCFLIGCYILNKKSLLRSRYRNIHFYSVFWVYFYFYLFSVASIWK